MNLGWLVAVLRPRDIASHPNFSGDGEGRAETQLANVLLYGSIGGLRDRRAEAVDDGVELAQRSFGAMAQAQGVRAFVTYLSSTDLEAPEADLCRHASLSIVAAAALAELDDVRGAIAVVDRALSSVHSSGSEDANVVAGALYQQRALRKRDAAVEYVPDSLAAIAALLAAPHESFPAFELSRGVSWTSRDSLELVRDSLIASARSLLPTWRDDYEPRLVPTWDQLVRNRPDAGIRDLQAAWEQVYESFVQSIFEGERGSSVRSPSVSDTDSGWSATTRYELLGSARVYASRRRLGQLRFVADQHDAALAADGLRLLRTSYASKDHRIAVDRLVSNGPLAALAADARTILAYRSSSSLRRGEFQALESGADFLTLDEARIGLTLTLGAIESESIPDAPGSTEAEWWKLESAWSAAVRLADACDSSSLAAQRLLLHAKTINFENELAQRAIAAAMWDFDWGSIRDDVIGEWRSWLRERGVRDGPIFTASLGIWSDSETEEYLSERPLTVADVASRVDRINARERDSGVEFEASNRILARAIEKIRDDARAGSHSFTSPAPLDVAAALLRFDAANPLWEPLAEALLDTNVDRNAKSRALERLALTRPILPVGLDEMFKSAGPELLESSSAGYFSNDDLTPFPAALRFLGACDLLMPDELLAQTARLAGLGTDGKREAARTIALLASSQEREWHFILAMQLSHDVEAEVQAYAGQCLASVALGDSAYARLAGDRVAHLLGVDSLLVPLFVLRRLREADSVVTPPLQIVEQADWVAEYHASKRVRQLARELADRWLDR